MKSKATIFLKQVMSLLKSIAKAKSMAMKSKANAVKARLFMFPLMKSKKLLMMGSISEKIHTILGGRQDEGINQLEGDDQYAPDEDQSKAIVALHTCGSSRDACRNDKDDEDKYPDLTHSLFDIEEDDFDDPGGSIIDLFKNSKEDAENFSLEDEIDHVADLFIMRFHKQMRLQKLQSFKRFQEMLQRSA